MGSVDEEAQAVEIARSFGVQVDRPVLLQDTNNVVLWLSPSPVVAKVGTTSPDRLTLELDVGLFLSATGAPIVGPSPLLPQQVHRTPKNIITYWNYEPESGPDPDAQVVASALKALHQALAEMPVMAQLHLASYDDELRLVRSRLSDSSFAPLLNDDDRHLLMDALRDLSVTPDEYHSVIHGSPHRFNILSHNGVPHFIDFETVCMGPVEWDLAHLDSTVAAAYPGDVDSVRLERCRTLVSVKTAVWCWAQADRADMRSHAEHHLASVRAAYG
jgi:hypothetical protein